jgi:hypothetical protein
MLVLYRKSNVQFRFFSTSRAKLESSFKEVGINPLLGWTGSQDKSRVGKIYY